MTTGLLALIRAGAATYESKEIRVLDDMTLSHASTIADWLCIATNGPVELHYVSADGITEIRRNPDSQRLAGPH